LVLHVNMVTRVDSNFLRSLFLVDNKGFKREMKFGKLLKATNSNAGVSLNCMAQEFTHILKFGQIVCDTISIESMILIPTQDISINIISEI